MTTIERPTPARPPLSRAATIPSRYYLDPDILELEKERVFGRTWQLVARTDELQRVGDFVPATVLDEPIVITHGLDGELRAFYNVCRHRAGQVALSRGNRKSLQCRYHGWTYGLDGTLRAARRWRRPRTSTRPTSAWCPSASRPGDRSCSSTSMPIGAAAGRDAGRHPGRGRSAPASTSSTCGWSSGATTSSSATGRSTSTTTSRATTCRSRTRSSSRSSTTTATGSRSSATTRSSTRRSGS